MTQWEEQLPPLARERLARIGDLSTEEKERVRELDQLTETLSRYFKHELTTDELWEGLKRHKEDGKESLLVEAQARLLDSLSLDSTAAELDRRQEAIVGIETLKPSPNTSALESGLNSIRDLLGRYKNEMEQAYRKLSDQVARDPQSRLQKVNQGGVTQVVELSVEEAIRLSPEWNRFVTDHRRRYVEEFSRAVERLRLAMSQ